MKRVIAFIGRRWPLAATHAEQIMKFAVCGGTGAMIDLGSLTLFVEYMGIDPRIAVVPSSLLSITFVFLANRFFTFQARGRGMGAQAIKFALVYAVAIMLNWAVSWTLLWLGVHYLLAKALAIGMIAAWNYTLSHGFVFTRHEEPDVIVF